MDSRRLGNKLPRELSNQKVPEVLYRLFYLNFIFCKKNQTDSADFDFEKWLWEREICTSVAKVEWEYGTWNSNLE